MTVISVMESENGSYKYTMPFAFNPNYSKHKIGDVKWRYSSRYEVKISASGRISNLTIPEVFKIEQKSNDRSEMLIASNKPCANMILFYKT